jgi:menaquinone-dependent protoporphyrinogen oxidase
MTAILALYGTAYGQTERVVQRIADRLQHDGLEVRTYRGDALPRELDVSKFDAVLVGASVIRGMHQPYVRDFVRRHAARLNLIPSAFVSVSGAAGSPLPDKRAEAQEYVDGFLKQTAWHPTVTATFGGTLAYTKYGFLIRWIIKRIAKQSGGPTDTSRDHETTDWDAVDRFARDFAAVLPERVTP